MFKYNYLLDKIKSKELKIFFNSFPDVRLLRVRLDRSFR